MFPIAREIERRPAIRARRSLELEALEDRTLLDAGFLDPTFGTGGRVLTDFTGSLDNPALAVVRQPDGKLLALGYASNGVTADLALARYNADGSLDAGFGAGGRARTDFGLPWPWQPFLAEPPVGFQLQADDRIAVAAVGRAAGGSSGPSLALARFTAAGALDTSFGSGGKVVRAITPQEIVGRGVVFQPDGKILVASHLAGNPQGPTVFRFLADGVPDTGFGTGGSVTTPLGGNAFLDAAALMPQADGKILHVHVGSVGGLTPINHILIRHNADGSLDTGFGTGGTMIANVGPDLGSTDLGVTLQPDGRIVVVGALGQDFVVVRYTVAGAFDASFGMNGRVTTDFFSGTEVARAVTVQADGRIVVAGRRGPGTQPSVASSFALARYGINGVLDGNFGAGGKVLTSFGSPEHGLINCEANSVVVESDGRVVAAGAAGSVRNFALARYGANGTLDNAFGNHGRVATDFAGSLVDAARAIAIQADGKLVVAGTSSFGRTTHFALVRYLASGALDPTFGTGGRVTTSFDGRSRANAVVVQPDGKIVAAGTTGAAVAVARYNADGSLDGAFSTGGKVTFTFPPGAGFGAGGEAHGLALQADGKLVLVGSCFSIVLARLNANGTLDNSFGSEGRVGACEPFGRNLVVSARVAVRADGKLVVATAVSGTRSGINLTRYNADGSLDASFNNQSAGLGIDLGQNGPGLRIQPDGKILVASSLPTANVFQFLSGVGFGLARFNADGSADTGFGTGGKVALDFAGRDSAADVLVQANGQILVVGWSSALDSDDSNAGLTVTRLFPNGKLNTSFGVAGAVRVAAPSPSSSAAQAALTPDGKLVVVGAALGGATGSDFFAARFDLADTYTTANQRYVGQLYLNLLGRSPDAGGFSAFVGLLDQGAVTRDQLARIVTGSAEYATVLVQGLYRTLLGREADPGGLTAFAGFLGASGSVAQVKAAILGSVEYFENRTDRTNEGLVRALYRDVLGRDAESAGLQIFTQQLAGGTARVQVATQIAGSRESLERVTQGWYRQYLRRGAEPTGLAAFVGFLQAGGSERLAAATFFSSAEFVGGL